MISTDGKVHIKRYLAGQANAVARSIAFGIGGRPEDVNDTSLQFETGRTNITLVSYDYDTDTLIFKAPIPDDFAGTIQEVALYSLPADSGTDFDSRILSSFDSVTENWEDATTGAAETYTVGARLGIDSLSHKPAASGTKTSSLKQLYLDFSSAQGADKFVFAYNVGNTNTTDIKFRFMTDAANYYEYALGSQTVGFRFVPVTKSAAAVVGTPTWSSINEIQVSTTSGTGGASDISLEGIRFERATVSNPDYVMVSRELLPTPFTKEQDMVQDIEFSLVVNV